jgi:hypothetical protein
LRASKSFRTHAWPRVATSAADAQASGQTLNVVAQARRSWRAHARIHRFARGLREEMGPGDGRFVLRGVLLLYKSAQVPENRILPGVQSPEV